METPRFAFRPTTSGHLAGRTSAGVSRLARRVGVATAVLGLVGAALAGCSAEAPDGTGNTAGSAAGGTAGTTAGTPGTTAGTTNNTAGVNATGGTNSPSGGTAATTAGTGGTNVTTGGAGGTNSSGGSGGTSSNGGMTNSGGRPSGPSAGCMVDPPGTETPGQNVLHTIDITGMAAQYVAGYTHRKYCTTIPKNYDPTKPYPVVFYGPGCGATACEGSSFSGHEDVFIVQAIAGADAKGENIVPKNGAPGCFQAGREGTADSPEGFYFDQVMNEVEAKYCVDKSKIFAAGTSSGAWLSNYLACARGNRVRGTVADSGGLHFDHGVCTGGAAVMDMPGDAAVTQDSQKREIGAASVRDMFIEKNGCSKTPTSMMFGGKTCDFYGGCADPVVWCNVGGGHQSGNSLLYSVGMAFWSTLK